MLENILKPNKKLGGIFEWVENSSPAKLRKIILGVVFLFIWSLTTHEKYSGTGDEPHYMMICHSLVFDGDLDLSNNYGDKSNLIYGGNLTVEEVHARVGRGNHLYPVHDIGMPLLFSPYYFAAYSISNYVSRHGSPVLLKNLKLDGWGMLKALLGLPMIFLTGFLAIFIFDLCFYLTQKKTAAFFWAILTVLSPPLLSHSFLFYTEILTAFLALYIYKWIKMKEIVTNKKFFWVGFLMGFLLLIHIRNISVAFILLLFILYRIISQANEKKFLLFLFLGGCIPIIFRSAINRYFWGDLLMTNQLLLNGPFGFNLGLIFKDFVLRIFAILLDQEGGLFIYAPIYVLAIAGLKICYHKSKETFWEVCSMFLFNYILIVSFPLWNRHGWSGFWSPAGRYLVPVIPFLAIGSFYLIQSLQKFPLTLKVIFGIQIITNLFFWQFPKLLWNGGDGISAHLTFLSAKSLNWVLYFPSWQQFSFRALYLSLLLAGMVLCLNGFIVSRLKKAQEI